MVNGKPYGQGTPARREYRTDDGDGLVDNWQVRRTAAVPAIGAMRCTAPCSALPWYSEKAPRQANQQSIKWPWSGYLEKPTKPLLWQVVRAFNSSLIQFWTF